MERKKITQEIIERVGRVRKSAYVAFNNPILEKTRLDAVLEMQEFAQSNTMDTEEKLDFIASKISNSIEEMAALLPENVRNDMHESMVHLSWRLQHKLAEEWMHGELPKVVGKLRAHDEGLPLDGRIMLYKDFYFIRHNYRFMVEISEMLTALLVEVERYALPDVIDGLLMYVEQELDKTAKFWMKWKPIVEEVQSDILLENLLRNMSVSQSEMRAYSCLYEKLMPEVLAKYCVTNFDAVHEFEREASALVAPLPAEIDVHKIMMLNLIQLRYESNTLPMKLADNKSAGVNRYIYGW